MTLRRYMAANLWQLQRYPEAKQNLQIILKEKPGDPPTLLLLGMVSENMKDYATAAKMLAAVPALVRQQPESIAALARSYYHLGSREKARVTLDELLKHPAGAQAVLLGAKIADEMQDYDAAKELLVSIPPTFPDQAAVRYRLALVEYHAKQFAESQQTLLDMIGSGLKSSDVNDDGWTDLFVARDASPNLLLINKGNGVFEDAALDAEVAYDPAGLAKAGMGVDAGDINGDGIPDFVVTML